MRAHFSPRYISNVSVRQNRGSFAAVCVQQSISHVTFLCCVYLILSFFKHLLTVCCAASTINHHVYELSGCILTAYAQLLIIVSASAPSFRQHCTDDEVLLCHALIF